MKLKKVIITAVLIITAGVFFGCANDESAQGIDDEAMRFQGILVGETAYDELFDLAGAPLADIDLSSLGNLSAEAMSGHYLSYEGFEIFAADKVQSININEDYSEEFCFSIQIKDTLEQVLAKLPEEVKQYELHSAEETPLQTDSDYSAHLIMVYDENEQLTSKVIDVYSAGGIITQLEFNGEDKLIKAQIIRVNN